MKRKQEALLKSEAKVAQELQLKAPYHNVHLWRNNVGACTATDGRVIRYGLANTSQKLNKKLKSSDFIGATVVTITPDMVGKQVAVFTSYETKAEGWRYKGTEREEAQLKWINLVRSLGGIADFITKVSDLWPAECPRKTEKN